MCSWQTWSATINKIKKAKREIRMRAKKGLRSTRLNKFVWFHQKKKIKVVSKFVSTFYQFRSHWNTVRYLLTTQSITQIYKLSKASKHPHVGIFNLIAGFLHKNYTFWPLDCLKDFHFKNKIKFDQWFPSTHGLQKLTNLSDFNAWQKFILLWSNMMVPLKISMAWQN